MREGNSRWKFPINLTRNFMTKYIGEPLNIHLKKRTRYSEYLFRSEGNHAFAKEYLPTYYRYTILRNIIKLVFAVSMMGGTVNYDIYGYLLGGTMSNICYAVCGTQVPPRQCCCLGKSLQIWGILKLWVSISPSNRSLLETHVQCAPICLHIGTQQQGDGFRMIL